MSGLTPHWPAAEDWAGFLLMIVPAGPLPVSGQELCQQVRAQIGTDPVLYDLVTVRLAPPLESTAGWDRGFVTSVVAAAMPEGHFFAPRGVIGVVVVSGDKQTARDAFDRLRELPPKLRLWVRTFGTGVRADSHTGIAPASVAKIAGSVNALIEMYDEQPQIAMPEPTFLGRVGALLEQRYLTWSEVEPEPSHHQPVERVAVPAPPPPAPPAPAPPAPVADAPAPKQLVEAVMYDGTEIVTVDQRTPIQRLTRQHQSDADCLDELRRDGSAVGLVHFVFVPDDGVVPRAVAKRRTAIALELDQLLTSVQLDAATGQPARIAVEVLAAASPLRKHGVLGLAGTMTEAALPKVQIEYFSAAETVPPLIDAARRTARALRARGVEVVSEHFIFLAALRFPADETTRGDWLALLNDGRVTWIDFSPPAEGREPLYPMPPSPFGLHVLTDKEDVVAVVKEQSEVIYRYARPLPSRPGPPEASAADGPAEARRWWPFGKRLSE